MSTISSGASSATSGQLGTGIDVASTVASLMQARRLPEQQLQSRQTALNAQSAALQKINGNLASLQTTVQALADFNGQLAARAATTSNSAILAASADGTAAIGRHQIVVTSLAQTSSAYTDAVATSSTPLATGTFSIKVGSAAAVPVTVDSTNNTLAGLAQTINAANIGVSASVITDASGARLSLLSSSSGAAGDITVTGAIGAVSFHKAVAGADASLTVDGIPVDSATNTVANVIPGVTLNLVGANAGSAVTLGIAADTAQASAAIKSFVSSYNTTIQSVNAQFAFTPGSAPPPLMGDSSLILVQQQLYSSLAVSGSGGSGINSLGDLGITVNNDGTLALDATKLSGALNSNNAAALNFFQAASTGFAQKFNTVLGQMTDPAQGAISVELKGAAASLTSLQSQIGDFEDRMTLIQNQLTKQFDTVNTTLQQMPLLLNQINSQLG